MSEVKKLIISRKKTDNKGNEYALIKISTSQQKRPEIRVIKFKKSPKKKKKQEPKNDENSSTTKSEKISNKEILKKNLKSKISDSPSTKSSKFTSFISTFNTPSKGKNSFIYNSPKQPILQKTHNLRYLNHPYINNYLYSPNYSKNNSEIFKTEYSMNVGRQKKEQYKNRDKEHLNNKIIVLSRKNKQYIDKINNLKLKQSKINNIKIKKQKDKRDIKIAKNKEKYQTEFKKRMLSEIKEINKYKKQTVKCINAKEKNIQKSNIKKDNNKVKNMIKNIKKINYQKNRENYLKIRKEEEQLRNKRLCFNLANKKLDNHFSFAKLLVEDDQKEIEDLKRKYEKLKLINSEYNSYIKEMQNMNFQRTFTPAIFPKFERNHLSYSIIETIPRKNLLSYENSPRKNVNKSANKNNLDNNNI